MSTSDLSSALPPGVRLELLPPRSRRVRNVVPRWDVWLDSMRIGRIEQWTVASSSAVFYRATALHNVTGAQIPLESSTDLAERVAKVVAAWHDPEAFVRRSSWDDRGSSDARGGLAL